ncbi:MAG: amidohydrolase, partial [Desulfatiglandales bacterium]
LMNPRNVYWATLWGCVELIKSGITCVMDGYFFEEEVGAALGKAGIRGVLGQGVLDYPTPDTPDPTENLKRAREFVEETLNRYPLITPSIFCHSPLTVKKETIVKAKELCSEYGIPLQMHVSETEEEFRQILYREGLTPVSYLDSLGVLDPEFVSVHVIHITDGDLEILSQRGVKVVHCPESNMKLSSGVARVHEMLQRGLVVGIGTDSVSSNNNTDLFREIDMATKLQKAVFGDATLLNARDGLRMGTSLGAFTVGMEDRIGSLSEGKEADFIVVDLDRPHLFPIYDPYSLCVYSLKGSDVRDVIISGRVIMENKRILTIDVEEARAKVGEIVQDIRTDWFHLEGEG